MANEKIKEGFERALLLEVEDVQSLYGDGNESRSEIDPASDRRAFEDDLDRGSEASDFDTDGQEIDVTEAQARVIDALYDHVDKVESMINGLNDPRDENSLNRFLAKIERPDSVGAGLSEKLTKHITKASIAIATLKEELRSVLGREEVINRKLEAVDSKVNL